MFSKKVIRELKDEMFRLRLQANRIAEILAECGEDVGELTSRSGQGEGDSIAALPSDGSFSGRIRSALAAIGASASSREVADRMIELGEPKERNGKPLRQIVSVALFRMSKGGTGGVRKVQRGRYKIDDTTMSGR